MKKRFIVPLTVFSMLLSFGLSACGGNNSEDNGGESGNPQTTSSAPAQQQKIVITAENGKNKLMYGETVKLSADVEGVTWASKTETVATIDQNGLVTAVSKGSSQITATKEGYKQGTLTITVDYPNITVTADKTSLLVGGTATLTASEQGVTWSSSDATVASVENGVVTANKLGSATIKASKDHFNDGSVTINVVRPDPTATLHFEDAEHYSSDGTWGTNYNGTLYGPGEESPVYSRSSGNASNGTCIAYMDKDDTETLTFTSSVAVKAELVMTMASRSAVSNMGSVMDVTLNNNPIDLEGKEFAGGGDTNTFVEFSLGEFNLQLNNVLHFEFKASSPYFDDLNIYAESAATIAVVKPIEKDPVTVNQDKITVAQGKTSQITSSMTDLKYKSSNDAVATVTDAGVVTGVAPGETTIAVSKDGYKTIRVPVTVTEVEGAFVVSIEGLTGTGVSVRTSQNLSAPNNYIIDEFPADAVGTLAFNAPAAGTYVLHMNARASGGYNSSTSDDLATCMELKVNGTKLTLTNTVSGSFKDYVLGEVTIDAGPGTIEITCKTAVPTINLFKFIPAQA